METVTDFIFLGSKITADGDCSHEIKRHLLLGRKVMTNLDSILKSRDITLSTKVRLVSSVQFSRSVMSDSLPPHEQRSLRAYCPKGVTRGATTVRSLSTATRSSPRSPQLEKVHTQRGRPSAAEKKEINLTWVSLVAQW